MDTSQLMQNPFSPISRSRRTLPNITAGATACCTFLAHCSNRLDLRTEGPNVESSNNRTGASWPRLFYYCSTAFSKTYINRTFIDRNPWYMVPPYDGTSWLTSIVTFMDTSTSTRVMNQSGYFTGSRYGMAKTADLRSAMFGRDHECKKSMLQP